MKQNAAGKDICLSLDESRKLSGETTEDVATRMLCSLASAAALALLCLVTT